MNIGKIELPDAPAAAGAYVPCVSAGSLVLTAGILPIVKGEVKYQGKVGQELTLKQGQEAAKLCLLNGLAALKAHIGNLEKIKQVVRLNGYVNSAPGFTDQHKVMNAVSDMLVEIFGAKGKHTRIAVGMAELPLNVAVELDLIVEVTP